MHPKEFIVLFCGEAQQIFNGFHAIQEFMSIRVRTDHQNIGPAVTKLPDFIADDIAKFRELALRIGDRKISPIIRGVVPIELQRRFRYKNLEFIFEPGNSTLLHRFRSDLGGRDFLRKKLLDVFARGIQAPKQVGREFRCDTQGDAQIRRNGTDRPLDAALPLSNRRRLRLPDPCRLGIELNP